ncbi:RepB family plasmid replication initiator protein, partial [Elizabethkingia argentiflava]|nr:RepB family plasmid replication initiator protein [Elizabethkingia argenteiflava]
SLFDQRREPVKEVLKTWYDFRKVFLDPAIKEINSNKSLDISIVTYLMIKKGNNVFSLDFNFIPPFLNHLTT